MTSTYTGEAQIAIKAQQSSVLVADRSLPVATQVAPEMVQTESFALQSRALASATIVRLHLDLDPEFEPTLRKPTLPSALVGRILALLDEIQNWIQPSPGGVEPSATSNDPGTPRETDESTELDKPNAVVVNSFISRLSVTVQPKSNVIRILFKSSQPVTAAAVPNTLVRLYLDQLAEEKDQALVQEREQLDKIILPEFREKMEASENALSEYRQRSGLISDRNATVLGQELSVTRAQLGMAQTHTAEAILRLREAERNSVSPGAASEPLTIERLREREVALQGQLAAVRGSHGPNYPQTMQLEAELKELRDGIRRESSDALGRFKTGLEAAQETEATLRKRVSDLTRQFALVTGGDSQLQNLIGQADADRKAYERYLARSNELRSTIGHAQPDAALLSPADVPLKPSPSPKKIILGGIVIGAGLGLIWVSLLDGLLKGLRNQAQIEETIGIKCIGLVPKVTKSPRYWFWRREQLSDIRDFTLNPRYAAFGEAVRSAQTKLLSFDRPIKSRVFLITAALPNEGKSWVAASLALSLAADGRSVALVDCDVNRPTVHRIFAGSRAPGLSDYLIGRAPVDEIIHGDDASGLYYIPIGSAVPKDTWRRGFGLIRSLVDQLQEKYAFVILDSAPVLAVSDTISLSQIAEKTILVVKWGSTPPGVARYAADELLQSAGTEIAGILSMVNTKRAARDGDLIASVYKELQSYYQH